jgi:hypothetical protein
MADQNEDDRLSRPLASGAAVPSVGAPEGGAAGRGLGGLGGDDAGSSIAGAGGLTPGHEGQGAGGLDSRNLGGGAAGDGQTQGVARQNQTFGLGGEQSQDPEAGGLNEQQDQLRAQAAAQSRTDALDAQGLLDKTGAQADIPGSAPNNDNL